MRTLYKWQPLRPGEIRLVELQPHPLGGQIIRRIKHVSLADDPALIHLARIKNSPNTETATDASEPCRLIWMDAISISQEDKEEKGAQVRMMTDIF